MSRRPRKRAGGDPPYEMSIACPDCNGREHHPGSEPMCSACGVPMKRAFFIRGERVDEGAFRRALLEA